MKRNSAKTVLLLFCAILGVSLLFILGNGLGGMIAGRADVSEPVMSVYLPPLPSASDVPASPTPQILQLVATSAENDLQLSVCDSAGVPVTGQVFTFTIISTDGAEQTAVSDENGTCYLSSMAAGDYTVKTQAASGQLLQISATVQAPPERVYMEDLTERVEITSAEAIEDEVKTEPALMQEVTVAEELDTAQLTAAEVPVSTPEPTMEPAPTSVPSPEPTEVPARNKYTYTYRTDSNHFLYYRDSDEVSSVMLFDEGVEIYGVVCEPVMDDAGSPTGEWTLTDERVELVTADGSVNPLYEINAEEIQPDPTPEPTAVPSPEPTSTPAPTQVPEQKLIGWQTENGAEVFYDGSGQKVTGFKCIDGQYYYFMPDGTRASAVGIDVSEFNGSIDWYQVKAQGISFVLVRAGGRGWSTGKLYLDANVQQNLIGARNAGLQVGVYFYSTAINTEEAVEEASLAISALNGFYPDLPIYFDTELSGDYPYGRADGLNGTQQAAVAAAFCETCENSGYSAGIYTNQRYFDNWLDYSAVCGWPIWLASYTANAALPNTDLSYSLWQFTSTGSVNGISGYADLNVRF